MSEGEMCRRCGIRQVSPSGWSLFLLPSPCLFLCFLLWAVVLWMSSSCSLCCSHPADSRLASEFRPHLSFFLSTAEQVCLSLSSWLHSCFLLPNSCSFLLSLCFYPALFCFPAPLRDPLLPGFLSSLDYLLSCWIRGVNHDLVQMIVNRPAKRLVAFPVHWCRAEKS